MLSVQSEQGPWAPQSISDWVSDRGSVHIFSALLFGLAELWVEAVGSDAAVRSPVYHSCSAVLTLETQTIRDCSWRQMH